MAKGASMLSPAVSGAKALGGHVYQSSGAKGAVQAGGKGANKLMSKLPKAETVGQGIGRMIGGALGMKPPTSSQNKKSNNS
jgi:hypothetical protein